MTASYSCLSYFYPSSTISRLLTLSLHDALPIWTAASRTTAAPRSLRLQFDRELAGRAGVAGQVEGAHADPERALDRKSTRLNSSHLVISYAVFCLKKKTLTNINIHNILLNVNIL